jgi:hypothetical protein
VFALWTAALLVVAAILLKRATPNRGTLPRGVPSHARHASPWVGRTVRRRASKTSQASGAASKPCFGALARSVIVDST